MNIFARVVLIVATAMISSCSTIKYNALEKVGIHKRDLLVSNVEDTRDAQEEAQEEFQDALEQFGSVVKLQETELKKAYDRLKSEYEDSNRCQSEKKQRTSAQGDSSSLLGNAQDHERVGSQHATCTGHLE